MKGNGTFLLCSEDFGLLLKTAHYTVHSRQEIFLLNFLLVVTGCNQSGLIADIGDIGTGESRGLAGQQVHIDVLAQFDVAQVYAEHLLTLVQVGQIQMYLTVKTSCTQQGLVQNVHTVGGSQDYDTAVGAESVHLCEQLV